MERTDTFLKLHSLVLRLRFLNVGKKYTERSNTLPGYRDKKIYFKTKLIELYSERKQNIVEYAAPPPEGLSEN